MTPQELAVRLVLFAMQNRGSEDYTEANQDDDVREAGNAAIANALMLLDKDSIVTDVQPKQGEFGAGFAYKLKSLWQDEGALIDWICDRFETAWKEASPGAHPIIENYLGKIAEPGRSALLRELRKVELEFRGKLKEGAISPELSAAGVTDNSEGRELLPAFRLQDESYFALKFELCEEIGRGGMGIVYRAVHKKLGMKVAIKVTGPNADADRFMREARLLASIQSPFVVAVHDFDVLSNGYPMIVMEWVEGENLSQRIGKANSGLLPEDEVMRFMRHACEGMLAAENRGIIHRDLKPSNLLIDHQGRARVADFGLARGQTMDGDLSQSLTHTHAGQVMGTPHYMAPEQAEDPRSVDTRADIYSFGATFYHALTGKPPFEGPTAFSILCKAKYELLVSPRRHRPEISDRVNDVLERCLAKDPKERFASFAEVLKHLQPTPGHASPWMSDDDRELAQHLARYQAHKDDYLKLLRCTREHPSWNSDFDVYTFPRGQTLRIVLGDIVLQKTDALGAAKK